MLRIKNLTKKYGKVYGVNDISIEVKPGEIYGFIGPNGAGKSTTIRTILNLIKPTLGSIEVDGCDSITDNVKILSFTGYLPSELYYYENLKGIDLLKYSEKFYKKDCSQKRNELAEMLNLDLNVKISEYSMGNKKKLGIVDALQHEPDFIILDEPTGGLDPLIQQKFYDIIKKEKENGKTIFFSSHVLSEVEKICDRVAIIKEGKIVKVENIADLKQNKVKKIRLVSEDEIEIADEGITNFENQQGVITFLYSGSMKELITSINEYQFTDITIEEPDLEEIFIHYYE